MLPSLEHLSANLPCRPEDYTRLAALGFNGWKEFLDFSHNNTVRLIRGRLNSRTQVEDLVWEVTLALYRAIQQGHLVPAAGDVDRACVKRYLGGIVKNLLIAAWKTSKRRQQIIDLSASKLRTRECEPTPLDILLRQEPTDRENAVHAAIDSLDERDREVVVCRVYGCVPYAILEEWFDDSAANLATRFHRSMKRVEAFLVKNHADLFTGRCDDGKAS